MGDKRIRFERRVGRIGFMGKGGRIPARQTGSDAPHAIRLRIGDRQVSTSTEDIEAARHELTPMPDSLVRVFSREPEAVVRPETAQEAADALGICFEERTRVVPRGAATSGLGGAVPVRGGVVIDLKGLNRVTDIDVAGGTATVEAGARWSDVMEALAREGYAPPSYPTSASASTVGGYISSGGYGAGTLKNGNFRRHVVSLEVGLPSGFLVKATGQEGRYSIPSFAGTEGQVGIVTAATISIIGLPEKRETFRVAPGDLAKGMDLFEDIRSLDSPPHSVDLLSAGAARLYGRGWEEPVLMVTGEGPAAEVDGLARSIKGLLAGRGMDIETAGDAREAWAARLSNILDGTDESPFMSGGLLFSDDGMRRFVLYLIEKNENDPDLLFECRAVDRGRNLVTLGYRSKRQSLDPLKAFARVRGFTAAGAGMGGVPYGVGLWNSPYIDVILGKRKKELRRVKSEVDRLRIMNPGKFFSMTTRSGLRVPGWAMRAYFGFAGRS